MVTYTNEQVLLQDSNVKSLTNMQIWGSLMVQGGGSGYTSVPSVSITGGGGSGATATAKLKVATITVTDGGSNYTSVPSVSITGGGGSGATAEAVINDDEEVTAIYVTYGGINYTSVPSVSITGGGGSGAAATAVMSVGRVDRGNHGSGYTSHPTVTISDPPAGGVTAKAYAKSDGDEVESIYVAGDMEVLKSSSFLTFKDSTEGVASDMFVITSCENANAPLLALTQGAIIEKDLMVGGFIDSGQGALLLNYGLKGRPELSSPPCIELMSSEVPYPSGSTPPSDPEIGQLFNHNETEKMWNGTDWVTGNFTGYYDTLFLFKWDGHTPANLDLGDLFVHGDLTLDGVLGALLALANFATDFFTGEEGLAKFAAGLFTADADGRAKFEDGFINESKLADGSITNIKVANLDASKITTGYISADRVELGSLDAKIAHIGNAQIDDLNASKINAGFLSADRIDTGSIDAKIASISNAQISSLDASKITTGYLSASRIQTGSLNCDVLGAGYISTSRLNTSVAYISNAAMIGNLVVTSAKLAETLGINSSELPITVPTEYYYNGADTEPGYNGSYDGQTVSGYQDYYLTLEEFKFKNWADIKHFLKKVAFYGYQTDLDANSDPYIVFEYSVNSGSNWYSLTYPMNVTGTSYAEYSSTCNKTTNLNQPFWVRIKIRIYYKWYWLGPYSVWVYQGTTLHFKNTTLKERGFKGKRGDI